MTDLIHPMNAREMVKDLRAKLLDKDHLFDSPIISRPKDVRQRIEIALKWGDLDPAYLIALGIAAGASPMETCAAENALQGFCKTVCEDAQKLYDKLEGKEAA